MKITTFLLASILSTTFISASHAAGVFKEKATSVQKINENDLANKSLKQLVKNNCSKAEEMATGGAKKKCLESGNSWCSVRNVVTINEDLDHLIFSSHFDYKLKCKVEVSVVGSEY